MLSSPAPFIQVKPLVVDGEIRAGQGLSQFWRRKPPSAPQTHAR